jgi:hypothetical protein
MEFLRPGRDSGSIPLACGRVAEPDMLGLAMGWARQPPPPALEAALDLQSMETIEAQSLFAIEVKNDASLRQWRALLVPWATLASQRGSHRRLIRDQSLPSAAWWHWPIGEGKVPNGMCDLWRGEWKMSLLENFTHCAALAEISKGSSGGR